MVTGMTVILRVDPLLPATEAAQGRVCVVRHLQAFLSSNNTHVLQYTYITYELSNTHKLQIQYT